MAGTYSDDFSAGDRTSGPDTITVTSALSVTGTLSNLVNGVIGGTLVFVNGQTAQALTFDFGSFNAANLIVTEFKWYQGNIQSHGTWQFEGSDDNSSYTTLGATFTLGGSTLQTVTTPSGNTTGYRYYRLRQTAGTTSSTPALREIEFKAERLSFPTTDLYASAVEVQYMEQTSSDLYASGIEVQYMIPKTTGAARRRLMTVCN